ncbi:MAG TPA: molybdenum cofactor guanylyltransferase [Gemmatimonadaceae bacterium]|jgi:molybdopterin-guanine dinucleotide biosynthesis protein A
MSARAHCTGAILAGGRATRFGGAAKGLEAVGGVRIIDRVAAALRESCDNLIIIANDSEASRWIPGVPAFADLRTGVGPLGGLHAALSHARDAALVLAWDAPFVPAGLMRALRNAGEAQAAGAAVPTSHSLWGFEPLCAWYNTACLPAIERRIDAGDLRAAGWQDDVATVRVDASPWGDPDEIFYSVNSSSDLAIANARGGGR